jgi:Cu-Zn family superoxide dismutase
VAVLAACGSNDQGSATSGPATAGSTTGDQDLTDVARAELQTPDGTEIGTVTFSTPADDAETLVVRAVVSGLEAGFKGFHVHTIGKCEPDSADPTNPSNVGNFLSAGGHLKAEGENHAGHDGDLTSLQVRSDGTAELLTSTDALPLDALLDADGSAVMVHLGPDNFGNIPTRYAPTPDATTLNAGDSGGRAACGVLEAT